MCHIVDIHLLHQNHVVRINLVLLYRFECRLVFVAQAQIAVIAPQEGEIIIGNGQRILKFFVILVIRNNLSCFPQKFIGVADGSCTFRISAKNLLFPASAASS